MTLVVADRVKETTTTTGTGTVTLAGAVVGFQSFAVVGDGNTTYYTITSTADWEVGVGTYTASGTTLSRDTVLASSNSGSLVNFGSGEKEVFVTYPAGKSVYLDGPYVEMTQDTASPNNTVNTSIISALAPSANADLVLRPKGTGSLLLANPDNTTTGGNKRGIYNIDLQTYRTNADNITHSDNSYAFGADNHIDYYGVALGIGGYNSRSTSSTTLIGLYARNSLSATAIKFGAGNGVGTAGFPYAAGGGTYSEMIQTVDATQTRLKNGTGSSFSNYYSAPIGGGALCRVLVVAAEQIPYVGGSSTQPESKAWEALLHITAENSSNISLTNVDCFLVSPPIINVISQTAGAAAWDITFQKITGLRPIIGTYVTGDPTLTVNWCATWFFAEVASSN